MIKAKNSLFSLVLITSLFAAFLIVFLVHPLLVEAQISSAAPSQASATEQVLREGRDGKMALRQQPLPPDKVLKAVMTVYTSTPEETDADPFIAASGKRVYDGMIANNCLKFGTNVTFTDENGNKIFGDKVFTVHDRMNARYGCNRFDMWVDQPRAEARKFGVKRLVAQVYLPAKKAAPVSRVATLKSAELAVAK